MLIDVLASTPHTPGPEVPINPEDALIGTLTWLLVPASIALFLLGRYLREFNDNEATKAEHEDEAEETRETHAREGAGSDR